MNWSPFSADVSTVRVLTAVSIALPAPVAPNVSLSPAPPSSSVTSTLLAAMSVLPSVSSTEPSVSARDMSPPPASRSSAERPSVSRIN